MKKYIWGSIFSIIMVLAGSCKPIAQETYREMESSSSKTVNLVLMQKGNDLTTLAVCSDKGGCENSLVSKDGSPYHFANTQAVNKAIEKVGTRSKHGRMFLTAIAVTGAAAAAVFGSPSAYKLIKNRFYTKMTQKVSELKGAISQSDYLGATKVEDIGDHINLKFDLDIAREIGKDAELAAKEMGYVEDSYKTGLLNILKELEDLPKTNKHAAQIENLKQSINEGNWSKAKLNAESVSDYLTSQSKEHFDAVTNAGISVAGALVLVDFTRKDKQLANRRDELFSFLTTGKPMSVNANELDIILDSITQVTPAKVNKDVYKHFQQ